MQPERKTKNIRKNYVSKTGIKLELPNTADRRERARQSAVNTRIRRKAYIEQLEQKVCSLLTRDCAADAANESEVRG